MQFLDRIRDAILGKRIVEPVFGKLWNTRFRIRDPKSPEKYYVCWQGYTIFPPLHAEIGVSLPSDANGPHEKQREMFREIEFRWLELTEPLSYALFDPFNDWFEGYEPYDVLSPAGMFEIMTLVGMTINHPTLYAHRRHSCDFDLGFTLPCDMGGHSFVARVKDWEVTQANIE